MAVDSQKIIKNCNDKIKDIGFDNFTLKINIRW